MNIIKHHTYKLEFDTWEPMEKQAIEEVDRLGTDIRCKKLLAHCGAVRLIKTGEVRVNEKGETVA